MQFLLLADIVFMLRTLSQAPYRERKEGYKQCEIVKLFFHPK